MKSGLSTRGRSARSTTIFNQGFTIMETLIFLAVSGALLIIAFNLIGGSQNKTQFQEASNDFQENITTIINNVANGYYPTTADIPCKKVAGGEIDLSGTSSSERGSNKDCIFVGRVMIFSDVAGSDDKFKVYNIAGAKETVSSSGRKREVTNMKEAAPQAINLSTIGPELKDLKNGIKIAWVKNMNTGGKYGAIGFFTSFGQVDTREDLESGSLQTNFATIVGSSLATDDIDLLIKRTGPGSFRADYDDKIGDNAPNPARGIKICYNSGTTDQHGVITIGGDNRNANVSRIIEAGKCPA